MNDLCLTRIVGGKHEKGADDIEKADHKCGRAKAHRANVRIDEPIEHKCDD